MDIDVYLDESGDSTGFIKPGSSQTFNIAFIKVRSSGQLRTTIKRFTGQMINWGWPRRLEMKANTLYRAHADRVIPSTYRYKDKPRIPIESILAQIAAADLSIDYITVNKARVSQKLRTAPAFVFYNYLVGQLIGPVSSMYDRITLYYDQRNKETRVKYKFDGYVITKAYESVPEGRSFKMKLLSCDSAKVHCIRAVDYVSWAIHRKYEFSDSSFYDLITHRVENRQKWFYK